MFLNNPCIFLKEINVGCGDYNNRPDNPCKQFKCGWLQDDDNTIPDWMKPSISNAIIIGRYIDGERLIKLVQCGDVINPKVLEWFLEWAGERVDNIEVALLDNVYYYGETLNKAVSENRYVGGI